MGLNSFDERQGCQCGDMGLRFSKILVKGLEIYAELKDIVDKDIYEETLSARISWSYGSSALPML